MRLKIIHSAVCCIIGSFMLLLVACKTESNAVYDLLMLRTEIETNHSQYTQSEWENATARYNEICGRLDEMPLTNEERMEVEKIKGEIAGYTASIIINDIEDKVQNIIDEVVSFSEGFFETFQSLNE